MSENSAIEWTTHTFNPWQGCVKVSEACRNCYAATLAKRFGVEWGPTARRKFQSESYWQQPLKWNRQAEKTGTRPRVFCASMADVFEWLPSHHPDAAQMDAERVRLWNLIHETPALDWLLLTKRPENAKLIAHEDDWPENVWLGTTVENQEQAEKRIPELLAVNVRVRFLSCEPLLGPVNLRALSGCTDPDCWNGCMPSGISWVIAGGESGHGARPTHPAWFRSLRDQCQAAGVPFFFKQWGEFVSVSEVAGDGPHHSFPDGATVRRVGKKAAGRTLAGRTWDQFPEVAR